MTARPEALAAAGLFKRYANGVQALCGRQRQRVAIVPALALALDAVLAVAERRLRPRGLD